MKFFLLLFLFCTPSSAELSHTVQSVVSIKTEPASATAKRVGTTVSLQGTNLTPTASGTSGALGGLTATITAGVPSIVDTTYAITNAGDAWSLTESIKIGDTIPSLLSGTVTNGNVSALPIFGEVEIISGSNIGDIEATLDSGQALTLSLEDTGSGVTATMQSSSSISID